MLQPTPSQAPKGLLPKGSRLHGEIDVAQGLRIEGEVQGHVRALDSDGATLVVAEGAVVIGMLEAAHVVVHGQVQGPIVATQSLQVMAGADIEGELRYRHLVLLHPEAVVRGALVPILGMASAPVTEAAAPEAVIESDAEPEASGVQTPMVEVAVDAAQAQFDDQMEDQRPKS